MVCIQCKINQSTHAPCEATIEAWYFPGWKKKRRFRDIKRTETQKTHVKGLRSDFTPSVKAHVEKFRRPNQVDGLMAWQATALEMRASGLEVMHSGAIPVERLWSIMSSMIPANPQRISPQWFQWISTLSFLRYSILQARRGSAPPWARGDMLLAQRLG